jgi:hypothetical protein
MNNTIIYHRIWKKYDHRFYGEVRSYAISYTESISVDLGFYSTFFSNECSQSYFLFTLGEQCQIKSAYINHMKNNSKTAFVHSKKNWCSTEPPKKVSSLQKSLQTCSQFQNHNKKFYETFKGSSRVPVERSFSYETFF